MNPPVSAIEQRDTADTKTFNVVVAALGGQGGGVLVDWISGAARDYGWPTQATSVPGVAQRTGATIYYLELFPADRKTLQHEPVMSLFPMQNNVDLVVASEVVEAGRMVQRGFVSPERTTLIASDHRVYAIAERAATNNSVIDAQALRDIATDQAKALILFDMQALAESHSTVISATLLGAVAGSGALPIARETFEAQIKKSGMLVEANLSAFAAAFAKASKPQSLNSDASAPVATIAESTGVTTWEPTKQQPVVFQLPVATSAAAKSLLTEISTLPAATQETAYHGAKKLADYQDFDYALEYIAAVKEVAQFDDSARGFELSNQFAKQLALWRGFEDIIRVAHLKIRKSRWNALKSEVGAGTDDIVEVKDFFKPRVEEVFGVLPHALGKRLLASSLVCRVVEQFTGGKQLGSNHIGVFLLLRGLAALRRFRRMTHAHVTEAGHTNRWHQSIRANTDDYPKALALAAAASLVKGYGSTRERGTSNLNAILDRAQSLPAEDINALVAAGLADDSNHAFDQAVDQSI